MFEALGDHLKSIEATETDRRVEIGKPIIVRVDGRSFSKFTRGMRRPFDPKFADLMTEVAKYLLTSLNAQLIYTQSDEITLVFRNGWQPLENDGPSTHPPVLFGGRMHKLTSVIASLATARFLQGALINFPDRCGRSLPVFDCRVFQVSDLQEAAAVVLSREIDAQKNAVSMAGRAHFSPHILHQKRAIEVIEMLKGVDVDFTAFPGRYRFGAYVTRGVQTRSLTEAELAEIPLHRQPKGPIERSYVVVTEIDSFIPISEWHAILETAR